MSISLDNMEHMEIDILPLQSAKNWKKMLHSWLPNSWENKTGHGWRSVLCFMPRYYFFKYLWNEEASCHTCWSIMKQLAPRIAFCSILLSFHVHFWCGVIGCSSGGRHRKRYPAIQRMQVDSGICFYTLCLLSDNTLLRNTYIDSLSLCKVEDHCPSFFRACGEKQGTLGQVFPIAVSQIYINDLFLRIWKHG